MEKSTSLLYNDASTKPVMNWRLYSFEKNLIIQTWKTNQYFVIDLRTLS